MLIRKTIVSIILAFICNTNAQEMSIGLSGNYIPNMEENISNYNKKHNLFLFGADFSISPFEGINIQTGLTIQYSKKSLLNFIPETSGNGFGAKRNMELFLFELPISYKFNINKVVNLNIGAKLGIGYLKIVEKLSFYSNNDGHIISENSISHNDYNYYSSPFLESNFMISDIFIAMLGIEYKLLNYEILYQPEQVNVVDPDPNVINTNLPVTVYNYNFKDLNFRMGVKYIL